jgi:dTDP-4-dehydrorhamnose reductase
MFKWLDAQQMPKPKLLITGASGFLGWHLCQAAQANWQVYGTYLRNCPTIVGVHLRQLDLSDPSATGEYFDQLRPDAVIHTAAQSQPNFCQIHPQVSAAINITASLHLAEQCATLAIPLLFTSTDLVFDGQSPPYKESDPVSPLSVYGKQKVHAEQGILNRHPGATICRMPLMFGAAPTAPSFIQSFVKTLRARQSLQLFADEFRTPVSGETAAAGLLLLLACQVTGIIHLGGSQRLSRYQFGQILAEVLQVSPTLLIPCSQADVPMPAPRPADVSLDSNLAGSLGHAPDSVKSQLLAIQDLL